MNGTGMAHNKMLPFDTKTFLAKYGGVTTTKCRAHAVVYVQGDAADSVFYIQQGKVKLSVVSEQGKEAVVAILETGDLCGEGCLNGQPLRISTATTLNECIMVRLEKASVIRALHDNHSFSDFFIEYLLTQNLRLKEHLIDHLFNSSEKRLARALLLLANFGKEGRQELIIPAIDQQTLAKLIGTTRARVSHFMNKFRKLGFLEYNGNIRVHSSLLNIILHDPPNGIKALRTRAGGVVPREGKQRTRRDASRSDTIR
jgi:CRP/FNR family cyclic AMP-dependent transcriptional regulator